MIFANYFMILCYKYFSFVRIVMLSQNECAEKERDAPPIAGHKLGQRFTTDCRAAFSSRECEEKLMRFVWCKMRNGRRVLYVRNCHSSAQQRAKIAIFQARLEFEE